MDETKQILFILGIGIPIISTIGLFMIKEIIDVKVRVGFLEGRHKEEDENNSTK